MRIDYKPSGRAKKLRITVNPNGLVTVTYPKNLPRTEAELFVQKHQAWIEAQIARLVIESPQETAAAEYTWGSEYKTRYTTIRILAAEGADPFLRREGDYLCLYAHKDTNIESPEWQDLIKKQIENQLKREAEYFLLPRVFSLAKEKGINFAKLSITRAKTRWGSCSSQNHINLSCYCVTLPDELVDYVILHELAHVKHKNHSPAFWVYLEQLLPGALQLDEALKKYTTAVI